VKLRSGLGGLKPKPELLVKRDSISRVAGWSCWMTWVSSRIWQMYALLRKLKF